MAKATPVSSAGGEVLYADMRHFGCRAMRTLVMPALVLNYFGQAPWC
jgi:K+ transporter